MSVACRTFLRTLGLRALVAGGLVTVPLAQNFQGPKPPEFDWVPRLGEVVPGHLRFTESDGSEVVLADLLKERPTILVLLYYECPMLCDLVLDGLVRNLRAIDFTAGEEFSVVALTIDPDETLEMAAHKRKGYLESYGREVGNGWRFLLGDEASIKELADSVGFEYVYMPAIDEYAHGAGVTLLTPEGRISRYLYGVEFPARDLSFALIEASEGKIGSAVQKFLLRCFHYDPTKGRYGLAIFSAIRILGSLTALLLAFFVIRMLRRDAHRRRALQGLERAIPQEG